MVDGVKQPAYLKLYATRPAALAACALKTRTNRIRFWSWVVTDGPDNDFAVVDLDTAIELGGGYEWSAA